MATSLLLACLFLVGSIAHAQEPFVLPAVPDVAPGVTPSDTSVVPVGGGSAAFPGAARSTAGRTVGQVPPPRSKSVDEDSDFVVNIQLPGPDRHFERSSERQFFEKIRQDARKRPGAPPVYFPEESSLGQETFAGRHWPRSVATVEPSYVCHGRLLFEQPNFERYGWDLGVFSPLASAGAFYYDLALLPYHYWSDPCERWDCSAGKCLPGDPVPLRLYREKFSLTGLAAQAFVTTGLLIVIP